MKKLITTLIFTLLLVFPLSAFACKCEPIESAQKALEDNDGVFLGKVISVTESDEERTATFSVSMAWKGITENTVEVTSATHSCGIEFQEGDNYLMFLTKEDDVWGTDACSGSTSQADQAFLSDLGIPTFLSVVDSEPLKTTTADPIQEPGEETSLPPETEPEVLEEENPVDVEDPNKDEEDVEVVAVSAEVTKTGFPDVLETHPNHTAILYLQKNDIVDGFEDGSFKPTEKISRAAFTKIIIGSQFSQEEIDSCIATHTDPAVDYAFFSDTPKEWWFAPYVCVAKVNGVINGFPDGTFGPEKKIAFPAAAKIIVEAFGFDVTPEELWWYKPYIEALGQQAAIPESIGNLDHQITRAEMAEMMWRIKEGIIDQPSKNAEEILTSNCISFTRQPIARVDMERVRTEWLAFYNAERSKLGLSPYRLDDQLSRTAQVWSDRMEKMGEITHKRPGQQSYYDYNLISEWFKGLGLEFKNVNRMTFTENIGSGQLKCLEGEDCTDVLIEEMKGVFNFYLTENTEEKPHYNAIVNEQFQLIGMGISLDDNGKFYMTTHFGTEITSNPEFVCP